MLTVLHLSRIEMCHMIVNHKEFSDGLLDVGLGLAQAGCFHIGYTDSGLFGFHVVAGAKDVRKVLGAVLAAVQAAGKGGLTEADLKRAK